MRKEPTGAATLPNVVADGRSSFVSRLASAARHAVLAETNPRPRMPDRTLTPHPHRRCASLAMAAQLPASAFVGPFVAPGPDALDARIDLKSLRRRVLHALATRGTPAAHARLEGLDSADLAAGTVQDLVARGYAVALEEAASLCKPAPDEPPFDVGGTPATPKDLRRKKDFLVASGGARFRFSRRGGLQFIDRERELNVEHCVRFEDRTDVGTLDRFVAKEGELPRRFDAAFLDPIAYRQGELGDELILDGWLGRTSRDLPCRLTLVGRRDESFVRLTVRIDNRRRDHRLRIRFHGMPDVAPIVGIDAGPLERIVTAHGGYHAATLVRSCGRVAIGGGLDDADDELVEVPDAQCLRVVECTFHLGAET